jgi:class 3 adenylate cyclase
VASRVESLTKVVGEPLLVTGDTCRALHEAVPLEPLPPQYVKGHHAPVEVLRLARPGAARPLTTPLARD